MNDRNKFEFRGFVLEKVKRLEDIETFYCGDSDLNEYFHKDSALYKAELLTQTYCFYSLGAEPCDAVALVDFCNDALAKNILPNAEKRKIHHNKRGYKVYPAIKITRLGVDEQVHGQGIGTVLLGAIKHFFLTDNRTGCRFITVDAYREAIPFYERNGFILAKLEEDEEDRRSSTVAMFFDLKRLL